MRGKKGGENTNIFDEMNVISSYPFQQAVEDGVLVEIFRNRWKDLSDGMPIVATAHIFEEVSLAGLMEIWNEFVVWRKEVMPTLPEEARLFSKSMNSRKVWVIEDGAAFTIMYPEDYWLDNVLACCLSVALSCGCELTSACHRKRGLRSGET